MFCKSESRKLGPRISCFLAVLFSGLFASDVFAQRSIKVNLAQLPIGFPTLQYEVSLFGPLTAMIGTSVYYPADQTTPDVVLNSIVNGKRAKDLILDETKYALLTLDLRCYIKSKMAKRQEGFYLSPHAFMNFPLFERLMIGADIGYQKRFYKRLLGNFSLGFTNRLGGTEFDSETHTTIPRINIGVGLNLGRSIRSGPN